VSVENGETAVDIISLVRTLPREIATDAIARQLARSGPGICANHRAAGRARSPREFVARLAVALEEADETEFWLDTLMACSLVPRQLVEPRLQEAKALRAILYASIRTARTRACAK
jgi:four helix bundle protein